MMFSLLVAAFALTTAGSAAEPVASPSPAWLPSQVAAVEAAHPDPAAPIVVWRMAATRATPPPVIFGATEMHWVAKLQHHLTRLGVYRGDHDGVYGRETAAAVVAVHKLAGVERTSVWNQSDWDLELDHSTILARHPDEPDRVEVDITRQVLFVIRDSDIAAIVPISSGNGEVYWSKGSGGRYVRARTPRGDFTLFKHINGWRRNYLGALYKPWYFTPYYAIHGSNHVPPYPASHGCSRIPNWEADNMDAFLYIGMPVHIWDA